MVAVWKAEKAFLRYIVILGGSFSDTSEHILVCSSSFHLPTHLSCFLINMGFSSHSLRLLLCAKEVHLYPFIGMLEHFPHKPNAICICSSKRSHFSILAKKKFFFKKEIFVFDMVFPMLFVYFEDKFLVCVSLPIFFLF